MTTINQTVEHGYNVYRFVANNTQYEVLTTDNVEFIVYSQRHGLTGTGAPKVYDSLADLAKRSTALRRLATLIAATCNILD